MIEIVNKPYESDFEKFAIANKEILCLSAYLT